MGFLVLGLILSLAAWLAAKSPRGAVLTLAFLTPWNGLTADFGVAVSLYQLVLLPLIGVTLVRSLQPGWQPGRVAAGGAFLAYVLYGLIWSMLVIGFLPEAQLYGGALRGTVARAVIQLGYFLFTVAPVALLGWLALRSEDLAACGRVYIVSAIVLAVIGWFQLVVWYATGTNPIQIDAIGRILGGAETYGRTGAFGFDQLAIYRMNSLAGEPRQLGTTFVMAMLIIQVFALTSRRPPPLRLLGIWVFLLLSAAATYSTSAAAIWLIGTAVMFPAAWLMRIPIHRSFGSMAAATGMIVAALGFAVVAAEARGIPVVDLIAERTIERLDESGAVEDFDLAILGYFEVHPKDLITGLGIGDVHLYAGPYLDPQFAVYAEATVFVAKTGYLRLLSEVGVIGLVLFLVWYLRLGFLAAYAVRRDDRIAALVPFGAIALVVFLANSQIANEFWFTAGMLTASCAGARNRRASIATPLVLAAA